MPGRGLPLFFFFNRILSFMVRDIILPWYAHILGLIAVSWDHSSRVLFSLFEPSSALMKTTIRSNCTLGPPQRLLGYLSDKPFGPGNNFPELLLKHPSAVVRELP